MMSYNEKVDALVAFCDKYEEMLDNAKEGSDLWAFKELDKVYAQVDGDGTECKEHLVNAMMFLAERFNDEYEMSEEGLKAWCDSMDMAIFDI